MPTITRLVAALAAVLTFAGTAAAVPLDGTVLVSAPVGGGPLVLPVVNHSSTDATSRAVSADGRWVVFTSDADGLSSEDVDTVTNVYVRDRQTAQTILVSRANGAGGTAANGQSYTPAISSNGRYVVFGSEATNLADADEGGVGHVFLRDLLLGATELVDRADGAAGVIGNGLATSGSISNNGDKVVFLSYATNLGVPGGLGHIYVRDRSSDVTDSVDLANGSSTVVADTGAFAPMVSGGGAVAVFVSTATNLGFGGNPLGVTQVYRRLLSTTVTEAVSANAPLGNGDSYAPSISDDSTRVAFATEATDLDPGPEFADNDTTADIYVWAGVGVNRVLVSRAGGAAGAKGTLPARMPMISPDGLAVAFQTLSALEPAQDTNGLDDAYVRHLAGADPQDQPNSTRVVSRAAGAGPATGSGSAPSPTSLSGSFGVVYTTAAPAAGPDDDDEFTNVWFRLTVPIVIGILERNSLVSRPSGTAPFRSGVSSSNLRGQARSESALRVMSADGRRVAFVSDDDTLSTEDDDRVQNVFVRDLLTGETILLSRATGAAGAAANGQSATIPLGLAGRAIPPSISADGTKVLFVSVATNLVSGDANGAPDVFLRDLTANTTTRVSLDTAGQELTGFAVDGAISGDGLVVAFATSQSLVAADTNAQADVYVRTLATGAVELASRADGANGLVDPNDSAFEPMLDFDGSRVAFTGAELAPALDDANNVEDVFVRDLATDQTFIVSQRASAGQPRTGNALSLHPAIDAAGTRVAFLSRASNMVVIDSSGASPDVFVRDLAAGTTTVVSAVDGTDVEGVGAISSVSISDDGGRVAFTSSAGNLAVGDTNGVSDAFVRDMTTNATTLVSRRDGVGAAPAGATFAAISGNGDCAAFSSVDDGTVPGLPAGTDFARVFLRTLRAECPLDPPETTITGKTATRDRTPTFTLVSDEPSSTFTCRRGNAAFAVCAAPVTLPRLKDGSYTLQAIATDSVGQIDATAATLRFRVDTVRPRIRSASVGARLVSSARLRVRLSEAASLRVTFQRLVGGKYRTVRTVTRSLKSGRRTTTLARVIAGKSLPAGTYRLQLQATDAAGNRSATRTLFLRVG